jgi:hypothetical protein
MSGAESSRPGLNRLMADACARKLDCILVWKLDRVGRSLVDCLNNIRVLEENGVRFVAVTQRLDTDQKNPASRFPLHVLGAAAEFERGSGSGPMLGVSATNTTMTPGGWAKRSTAGQGGTRPRIARAASSTVSR